jgi:hypothetical protein
MDLFLQGCQGLGLALAAGMAAGAIDAALGGDGAARAALAAVAAIAAAVLFGASLAEADHPAWPGWIVGGAVGLGAFRLTSGIVAGAGQRVAGGRALGLAAMVLAASLVLTGLSLLVSPIALVALAAALWLAMGRRRRSQRKHEGLRVLR